MGAIITKICDSDQANGAKAEYHHETVQNTTMAPEQDQETVQNMKIPNPHKFQEIIKKADIPAMGDLKEQIRTGIFLDQNKKKFWVGENGHNCFMLFARDLTIVWGEDERYWHWISENETSDTQVEVAELKKVCWLEVRGKFDVSLLTPGITYQIFFVIKIKGSYFGWSSKPAKIQLKLPDGGVQKYEEKLDEKPKEQWIQIKAGEFETGEVKNGEIEIGFLEWDNPTWKGGLVIKGVMICPK